jgi:hypothetical protein
MDDLICQQFFLEPNQPLQRRYEALRAYFIGRQTTTEIAQQFGMSHGTVRNLVADFRAQRRAGQVPPFSRTPVRTARIVNHHDAPS